MSDAGFGSAEAGRRGGVASGETRRAKRNLRKDVLARQRFIDDADNVAKELLDAALGRGSWAQGGNALLDPKERAGILKTCLEYGVGRARAADPMPAEDLDDEPTEGFVFGSAARDGTGRRPATGDDLDGIHDLDETPHDEAL